MAHCPLEELPRLSGAEGLTLDVEATSPVAGLLRDLRAHLAWQREDSGVDVMGLERPPGPLLQAHSGVEGPEPVAVAPAAGLVPARPTLDSIRGELGDCQRCKLCAGRTNLVFGVGNAEAHLVFVGEGPGADEDAQGEPFVGKAGQLLNKMIEAMGYARQDVYICNVVKCRPPGNRNPEPDEIAACEPFLRAQLNAIDPEVVVALGKFAAQTLLRDATPITRLRGQWRTYQGMKLMPTFHPAYLLRNPAEKKPCWEDLKAVMAVLGKPPPKP
jgi:uracil-DNA glycosylase family 4